MIREVECARSSLHPLHPHVPARKRCSRMCPLPYSCSGNVCKARACIGCIPERCANSGGDTSSTDNGIHAPIRVRHYSCSADRLRPDERHTTDTGTKAPGNEKCAALAHTRAFHSFPCSSELATPSKPVCSLHATREAHAADRRWRLSTRAPNSSFRPGLQSPRAEIICTVYAHGL